MSLLRSSLFLIPAFLFFSSTLSAQELDFGPESSSSIESEFEAEADFDEGLGSEFESFGDPEPTSVEVSAETQPEAVSEPVASEPSESPSPLQATYGMVQVEYPPNIFYPYAARRPKSSWIIGPVFDSVYPQSYRSLIDGQSYQAVFGSKDLQLLGLQGGLKGNFSFGSLGFGLGWAKGQIKKDLVGDLVRLDVTRYQVDLNLWFDRIWQEPYFVPAFSLNYKQFEISERDSSEVRSTDSNPHWGFEAGGLFQLNWLDRKTALRNVIGYGLLNTYLGVFYGQSFAEEGPKSMASTQEINAKFLLEF